MNASTLIGLAVCAALAQCGSASAQTSPAAFGEPVLIRQAPVPAAAATPVQSAQTWTVDPADITLARAFSRWAKQAGYSFVWDAKQHVEISAAAAYQGNFEAAVEAVLASPGVRRSAYPLEACIYANRVLRVTRLGDQAADCPAN